MRARPFPYRDALPARPTSVAAWAIQAEVRGSARSWFATRLCASPPAPVTIVKYKQEDESIWMRGAARDCASLGANRLPGAEVDHLIPLADNWQRHHVVLTPSRPQQPRCHAARAGRHRKALVAWEY